MKTYPGLCAHNRENEIVLKEWITESGVPMQTVQCRNCGRVCDRFRGLVLCALWTQL